MNYEELKYFFHNIAPKHFPHPEGKQRWPEDYVSEYRVKPIKKIVIPNVRSYIKELIAKGLVKLNKHTMGKTLEQRLFEYYSPGSKMVRQFGNALLRITPLSPINQLFIGAIIKSSEKERNFSSDHLHVVTLNSHLIQIKEDKRGRKYARF